MMYLTGQNCNGEYIVLLNRDELNEWIKHSIEHAYRKGQRDPINEEEDE